MKSNSYMDYVINPVVELANKRKARIACGVFLAIVLLLLFLPLLKYPDPPPGQEGVLISFGEPELGREATRATGEPAEPVQEEEAEEEPVEEPVEEVEEEVVEETPDVEPETEPETQPDKTPDREVQEDINSKERALQKKKEEERKKAEEAERKRQEEEARKKAEAERKRQEAEARKKAEAEKLKNEIGDLFKNDDGGGRGNNDKDGNQGDPAGGDSDILEGITTGSGRVGGGLGNRGGSGPQIRDNSQATGRVVVRVCVDAGGNVVSAKFTQAGSTTANNTLISKAIDNAKRWDFKPGSVDKQCGTITYDFKVK